MEDADLFLALFSYNYLVAASTVLVHAMKKRIIRRRWWVHPVFETRYCNGYTSNLIPILEMHDRDMYRK